MAPMSNNFNAFLMKASEKEVKQEKLVSLTFAKLERIFIFPHWMWMDDVDANMDENMDIAVWIHIYVDGSS